MAIKNIMRTDEMQQLYSERKKNPKKECFMCTEEGISYGPWKLIKNEFPYDRIAQKDSHYLLVPNKHVEHLEELDERDIEMRDIIINHSLKNEFDCIVRNFPSAMSHPQHIHWHVWKNL